MFRFGRILREEEPNEGQGSPGSKGLVTEGTGTGGEGSGASSGHSGHPEKVPLKVNGEERLVTWDEAVAYAQKGMGADAKFQEAAKIKKEAEAAIRLQEDLRDAQHDVGAFRRVAKAMGRSDEEIDQAVAVMSGQTPQTPTQGTSQGSGGSDDDAYMAAIKDFVEQAQQTFDQRYEKASKKKPLSLEDMDPALKRELVRSLGGQMETQLGKILDTDSILGEYVRYGNPDQVSTIRERLKTAVGRRVRQGQDFWDSETQAAAIQEVRGELEKIGAKPANLPQVPDFTGLGPSSGSVGREGSFHPDKKLDRPKEGMFAGTNYDEYITKRLQQEFFKTVAP